MNSKTQNQPASAVPAPKTKFTPGPWTVEDGGMFECQVLGPNIQGAWDIMFQGGIDNARLISAAPDLFEALGEMLAMSGGPDGTSMSPAIDPRITRNKAVAALNKALGIISPEVA